MSYIIVDAQTGHPISNQVYSDEASASFNAMQLSRAYPDKILKVVQK